jgi:hypothetical protein
VVRKIDERLDLLSLPPSLTSDNLARNLKEFVQLSTKFSIDDQILYVQHVIPTLLRYFHVVYAKDTLELRVDADFLDLAKKKPSFLVICAIHDCLPSSCRLERDIVESKTHTWLFYNIRIVQTLQALLRSSGGLSFDSIIYDTIAIDLSDALVKSVVTLHEFPSLFAYHPKEVVENKYALHALEAQVTSLSEDARIRVEENLQAVKEKSRYFPDNDEV